MTFKFSSHRRRSGGRLSGSLVGLAAGAGLMFLLDPRRGRGRRSQVAQRAGRVLRDVECTVEAGARDLKHRVRGLAHEAAARVEREHASDEVIVERVRARLGRLSSHASAVRVASREGHVVLSGPVFSAEHAQVLRGVRLVRGVKSVEDHLQPHETAEGVQALQGAGPRPGSRPDPLQRHWAPRTRLLAGAAGALLVGRALFGSGLGRIPAGIAGAALLGKVMGDAQTVPRAARRAARAASEAANLEEERTREGERHAGAWHPEPEQGDGGPRARDRGGERGGGTPPGGGWSAGSEAGGSALGGGEVVPGPGPSYVSGDLGAPVRESDLGAVMPREPEEDEPRRGEGEAGDAGSASRREPT